MSHDSLAIDRAASTLRNLVAQLRRQNQIANDAIPARGSQDTLRHESSPLDKFRTKTAVTGRRVELISAGAAWIMVTVSNEQQPTYEELASLVGELRAALDVALARIADLEAQLKQNSTNSSKPPSSDSPFTKPAPKSLRGKSRRKPGGQPGHEGRTLLRVARPDRVIRHEPTRCGGCGVGLDTTAVQVGMDTRQVFDIPKITVRVVEHQVISRRCGCGVTSTGTAPDGITSPAQKVIQCHCLMKVCVQLIRSSMSTSLTSPVCWKC